MSPKNATNDRQRPAAAWPFVALGAAVIAAASFFAVLTWSSTSAVAASNQQAESDPGAKAAGQLAQEHGKWLREAHGEAHRAGSVQALPAQF